MAEKKASNMKNGEKTSPPVLQVMKAMGLTPMASEPQPQPDKRLKRKTPMPSQVAPDPVAPQPAMAAIQNPNPKEDQPEKAPATTSKILMLQGSSPKSNVENESSVNEEKEASVVSTQEISSTSSGMVSLEKLEDKSVKSAGFKRPASCMAPKKKASNGFQDCKSYQACKGCAHGYPKHMGS